MRLIELFLQCHGEGLGPGHQKTCYVALDEVLLALGLWAVPSFVPWAIPSARRSTALRATWREVHEEAKELQTRLRAVILESNQRAPGRHSPCNEQQSGSISSV